MPSQAIHTPNYVPGHSEFSCVWHPTQQLCNQLFSSWFDRFADVIYSTSAFHAAYSTSCLAMFHLLPASISKLCKNHTYLAEQKHNCVTVKRHLHHMYCKTMLPRPLNII